MSRKRAPESKSKAVEHCKTEYENVQGTPLCIGGECQGPVCLPDDETGTKHIARSSAPTFLLQTPTVTMLSAD